MTSPSVVHGKDKTEVKAQLIYETESGCSGKTIISFVCDPDDYAAVCLVTTLLKSSF